jgi:hypothetical protein
MTKRGLRTILVVVAASLWSSSPCSSAIERPTSAPSARPRHVMATSGPVESVNVANAPATGPTTQPAAGGWTVPPLTGEYAILTSRSMFLHGKPPPAHPATSGPVGGPPLGPGFVLRGVARQGEQPMALVEDMGAHQTKQMHIGDSFAGGKLVAITTDGVDRSVAGKVSHVKVGQPIEGGGGPAGMKGPGPGPTTQTMIAEQAVPTPMPPPLMMDQASTTDTPLAAGAKILPNKD